MLSDWRAERSAAIERLERLEVFERSITVERFERLEPLEWVDLSGGS